MFDTIKKWTYWSLVNLLIVAVLGVTLRYKGAFSLPVLDYKYLLHAHSHFAFSGWVTTILFTCFVYLIPFRKTYVYQFWLNQVASFGMLISFAIQGYGPVSIAFSALSVVFSYWFAFSYLKDIRSLSFPPLVKSCLQLAIAFLVISSAGPFMLAMGKGNMVLYNNAIYFYLHFQYNGWFTFGVMALFFWAAPRFHIYLAPNFSKVFVILMGIACVPAYCMSTLWAHPPGWVYMIAGAAGMIQLAALVFLILAVPVIKHLHVLWVLASAAFIIKIVLQVLTLITPLGRFAYGFRPVVIGYLHLVVLGFVSFLIVGFLILNKLMKVDKVGLGIFITGVIANEVILMVQCVMAYFFGSGTPTVPYWLLGAGVVMMTGTGWMVTRQRK
jgi:hypothetical protein